MSSTLSSGLFFDPLAVPPAAVSAVANVVPPVSQHHPDRTAPRREPEKARQTENRAAALQKVRRDLERLSRHRGRA